MNNWLDKYQFNDPWALWLLLFIPVSIALYYWMYPKKNEPLKISSIDFFDGISHKWTPLIPHFSFFAKREGISMLASCVN